MQFMATIAFDSTRGADIARELPAEQVRVRELQRQGLLETLYIPVGSGAPANLWVVFNGDSADAVQATMKTLPLYPYMQVKLTPLRDLEARS